MATQDLVGLIAALMANHGDIVPTPAGLSIEEGLTSIAVEAGRCTIDTL
jgi:hypothetical protein